MKESRATFSLQHTLPRLPIPSLEETCALYLKSIVPLQSKEEHEKTKRIVSDFLQSPLSSSLQQRLIDLDRASPNNWLEDNFWLRKAYLEWRSPLMVNSNWYILGQDDAQHPSELLANGGRQPLGRFSHFQVKRAAHMIHRGLEYKEWIDQEQIPVEMIRGQQGLCMWQYSRIFSVTRVPLYGCDTLVQADPKQVRHITVLLRDQMYALNVYRQSPQGDWVRMTAEEIERALLTLIHHVQHLSDPSAPVPLLTSSHRDSWTVARNHLLTLGNRAAFTKIEDSLFAVALDDYAHGSDSARRTKTMFCGHQGLGNGHNRWYDKSLTLVVESNGQCGFSGEHSPVDALIASWIFDHMLQTPCSGSAHAHFVHQAEPDPAVVFEHLAFKTDSIVDRCLREAQVMADETARMSDSNVLVFKGYGTDWIKRTGRVSPDAFYQMVLQLTYYRLHGKVTATYETAATRKFLRGRTETIRSCSTESKAFVEGFDQALDVKTKYELLVKATSNHRKYTQIASDGHGCDRHLLALRLLNADHTDEQGVKQEMHPLFTDPIFTESQTWRLSTSGLHAGIRLMGTGFGAVYDDGYGINYMAAPTLVKFGIETKRVPETASTDEFIKTLTQVLLDMKLLCEQVNNDNHSKL